MSKFMLHFHVKIYALSYTCPIFYPVKQYEGSDSTSCREGSSTISIFSFCSDFRKHN